MIPSTTLPSPADAAALPEMPRHVERLRQAIADIRAVVPPVWPLEDYVAVNPFQGVAHLRFLEARSLLRDVRTCDILPPATRFIERMVAGEITGTDIEQALQQCREEYPECYAELSVETLERALHDAATTPRVGGRRYFTVAEAVDQHLGSSWSSHIVTDISRQCAAHYDRGQAAWPSPWKHLPLFEAWRESTRLSRRMEMLGIAGFRRFVDQLPADPEQAVASLLLDVGVPEAHWRKFMLGELLSVAGWASFLRYRLWMATSADAGSIDEHLIGLLAMRLAYDVALAREVPEAITAAGSLFPDADHDESPSPDVGERARYLFQVAAEGSYRRRLYRSLVERPKVAVAPAETRSTLQMVFCIDVRSEVYRRHLEATGPGVETFGFAGFFGMPMEFVPLGESHGTAQCPVLLSPGFRVHDEPRALDARGLQRAIRSRQGLRLGRKAWKAFQTSATSCFSFVEALGVAYLPKLIGDAWCLTKPVAPAPADGVPAAARRSLQPALQSRGPDAVPLERRIDLAAGMLRNLGLVEGFARIVAICGHTSEVVNNPYRAGLDCGACGGHSGEPNARIAAALLNDPDVRCGLAARGIAVPPDTLFLAAVHCTTTDEIRFPDADGVPAGHAHDFAAVRRRLDEATAATRAERAVGLVGGPAQPASQTDVVSDILRRSRDWAEVRPEWGLANNAAFIVAPRSRTLGIDLGGRTFLHSYEHSQDPELKVLELIMTAPMVVTSWINLQYFASAVDNRSFGSGNKLIHNVTGQLGVLLGNGGDLMTGLPWQSVSDGERLRHEPLRLAVLIDAPRTAVETILDRHRGVGDLVGNGWLTLLVREGDTVFRWSASHGWKVERPCDAAV